jgi:hypothetical protein
MTDRVSWARDVYKRQAINLTYKPEVNYTHNLPIQIQI